MINFAQRDFVNTTPNKAPVAEATTIPNMIGKFVVLGLSTTGLVYTLMFMWMAHQ
ncbi:hypothetical protein [Pantoea sp. MBLJ3]|jgi:hypothetical protein|uniref:hypothetical protein n=1 Tax=Pantoea sp. MBLJ3 TaxID=1562889 RepID=UPI000A6BD697|nr:hypothetical protein [Pantoea sp. MBLJ3]